MPQPLAIRIQRTRFDWSGSPFTVSAVSTVRIVRRKRHARRLIGQTIRRGHQLDVTALYLADIIHALQAQEDDQ